MFKGLINILGSVKGELATHKISFLGEIARPRVIPITHVQHGSYILRGPTGSGRTHHIMSILEESYFYLNVNEFQENLLSMRSGSVTALRYVQDCDFKQIIQDLYQKYFDNNQRIIFVIDDFDGNPDYADFFYRVGMKQNCVCIFVSSGPRSEFSVMQAYGKKTITSNLFYYPPSVMDVKSAIIAQDKVKREAFENLIDQVDGSLSLLSQSEGFIYPAFDHILGKNVKDSIKEKELEMEIENFIHNVKDRRLMTLKRLDFDFADILEEIMFDEAVAINMDNYETICRLAEASIITHCSRSQIMFTSKYQLDKDVFETFLN